MKALIIAAIAAVTLAACADGENEWCARTEALIDQAEAAGVEYIEIAGRRLTIAGARAFHAMLCPAGPVGPVVLPTVE
jgi:hypothetical protein